MSAGVGGLSIGTSSASVSRPCNLEQKMRSKWNSLVVGGCNVFGLALLALSATAVGSTVRAEDPSALQNIVFEPLTKIVTGLESRVANLEASMAAFGESFAAKRIVARELCVADDSGAQTCITKAQLDALLRSAMQTGQAAAASEPGETERTAATDRSVAPAAPVATVEPPPAIETPPATEPGETEQTASADRSVATVETPPAIETPPAVEPAATLLPVPPPQAGGTGEGATAAAMPEVAAAMPPETQPPTSQPTAPAGEAGTPLAVEATVPSASEPAETIVATDAKPAPSVTEERAAKDEEPARTGATETDTAASALKAAPAEAP